MFSLFVLNNNDLVKKIYFVFKIFPLIPLNKRENFVKITTLVMVVMIMKTQCKLKIDFHFVQNQSFKSKKSMTNQWYFCFLISIFGKITWKRKESGKMFEWKILTMKMETVFFITNLITNHSTDQSIPAHKPFFLVKVEEKIQSSTYHWIGFCIFKAKNTSYQCLLLLLACAIRFWDFGIKFLFFDDCWNDMKTQTHTHTHEHHQRFVLCLI